VYIQQLSHLLNSEQIGQSLFSQPNNDQERSNLFDEIVSKLRLNYQTIVESPSTYEGQLDDAIQLLDSLSIFLYTSGNVKPTPFSSTGSLTQLVDKMKTSSLSGSTLNERRLAVGSLIALCQIINGSRFTLTPTTYGDEVRNGELRRFKAARSLNDNMFKSIFDTFKTLLNTPSVDAQTKSRIYQSFASIIKLNSDSIKLIIELLHNKLTALSSRVANKSYHVLNLDKCVKGEYIPKKFQFRLLKLILRANRPNRQ
jgi:hypothetical protein